MNDKIRINLNIAGITYPVFINREDEEIAREAAKQVNIKIGELREKFKVLKPEMIIPMVAYFFSLERLKELKQNDVSPYPKKLKELDELLDDYLKSE